MIDTAGDPVVTADPKTAREIIPESPIGREGLAESEGIVTKEIEDPSVESSCVTSIPVTGKDVMTSIVEAAIREKSKTNGAEPYACPSAANASREGSTAVPVAVVSSTPVEDSVEEALAVEHEASTSDVFVLTPAGTGKTESSLELGNAVLPAAFRTDASGDELTSPDADPMVHKLDASEVGIPVDVTDPLGASPWVTITTDAVLIENITLEAEVKAGTVEEKPPSAVNGVTGQQPVVFDAPASPTEVSAAVELSSKDISASANSESVTDRAIYGDPDVPGECPHSLTLS